MSASDCAILWIRLCPFRNWLKLVDANSLRRDLGAGLTGAVVVLPQGVAFAMIAGLPPEYGLYTAIIPPIIAALFGSSLHLISGPTTAISIVVFNALVPFAEPGTAPYVAMAMTLTLMVGILQLAMANARLGVLINFISHSVVVGFSAGAAVLIATSQMKHLLGVPLPDGLTFLHTLLSFASHIDEINPAAVVVGLATLGTAVLFKVLLPRWPGMLLAMIVGSVLAAWMGPEENQLTLIGAIPSGIPPYVTPDISLTTIQNLSFSALAIALLGLVEAVSIARSVAFRSQQRIDGNQEFVGQGMANIIGSFFSCYASSGSFTRTGLNFRAGAVTPLAAIFAALLLLVILLTLSPWTAHIPIAALGGILLLVAYNLIDFLHIRRIIKTSRWEAAVMIVTFLATLILDLVFAIYVGVFLSLMGYLRQTTRPNVVARVPDPQDLNRHFVTDPELPECPQGKILRVDGSIFFANVDLLDRIFREVDKVNPEQINLIILGNGINFVDLSGAEMLENEAERRRKLGGNLYFYGAKTRVCNVFEKRGFLGRLSPDQFFRTKEETIHAMVANLDWERCQTCQDRIFRECAELKKNGRLTPLKRRFNPCDSRY
ncbi:MAG: SulP family inorganic anion transporter [Magnetococcales bacterium]|nr:SulP family inorganic anion transporter [Magnetococcales bacterium]